MYIDTYIYKYIYKYIFYMNAILSCSALKSGANSCVCNFMMSSRTCVCDIRHIYATSTSESCHVHESCKING